MQVIVLALASISVNMATCAMLRCQH